MRGGTGRRWYGRSWSPLSTYTVADCGGTGVERGTEMAPLTGCSGVSSAADDEDGTEGVADDDDDDDDDDDEVGTVCRGVRMTRFP